MKIKGFNLQLFNDVPAQEAAVPEQTQAPAMTNTEQNIAKLKQALEDLEKAGEGLVDSEVISIEGKIGRLEQQAKDEAKAATKKAENDVEKIPTEIKKVEQSFTQKYGSGIANGLKIVLLAAIAGRLFGII